MPRRHPSAGTHDPTEVSEALGEGWQDLIRQVDPDVAVTDSSSALAYELTKNQGWTLVMTDGDYSLLRAPDGAPVPNR